MKASSKTKEEIEKEKNSPTAMAKLIKINYDEFKKITTYLGPNIAKDYGDELLIRAWKHDKMGPESTTYQIYITDHYEGEWRFYNSAFDSNGNSLKLTSISRDVAGCSRYGCDHKEILGLEIDKKYLLENQTSGIKFKISGKRGEQILELPPGYIQAFLLVTKQ